MNTLSPALAANRPISLPELLTSRESRQNRQQLWLARHQVSLISLTLVAPGAVKDNPLTRKLFALAWQAITTLSQQQRWPVLQQEVFPLPTGCEGLIAVDLPAEQVKDAALLLELKHPQGRLWDIDVLDATGQILSRRDVGLPPRRCLLCHRPANVCGRAQTHSINELLAQMELMLNATTATH
ncbi:MULTISPECIES: citrate lyase holo-[acyl-carrier protein] synthase [Yersinia]|uniref:Apo-citrate lyase phosphoribosyl-dephospho-CoA transferase n=2 Tax=Yersinia bercovieri TaxID=634 RepID=A0A2G4U4V5_YERBE|nr:MULTISPECIES: citrate lyase holo-[acyl-carrier protein] synthase [Yersinia]EEQ05053.1 Holo-ACP synthase [Yersinia bercovieri ATCC 43970]MDN0101669.1 citrate lyase holo-[acyl-carrier protein] synthase [Yersinia bercovieri]PHZ28348.1 citrate lyase holo-[acyl-carrier protein] synthase [Yersinia bercovieri]QDW33919.1 citrate lyase holo-[acyl-carrier protein] synthase [Yersinia sp. KBS0713]QKJ07878.1 citrate lyase holo-[acyl-carrier protein] synthase [Yersinia bercovieri ATCC 43970]